MAEVIYPGKNSRVQHMLAVMSGKGGTGKSTVTALLAVALQRQGQRVGILDADLACPSIARIFHLEDEPPMYTGESFEPVVSRDGIKIISVNMSESEEDPLAWRGPMVSSALKQFYGEVDWGELDFLLVDAPPGSADVPITVLQSLPLAGVMIVSTPPAAVVSSVKKCVNMAHHFQKPIIGVVENMAYLVPSSGEHCHMFTTSAVSELLTLARAPMLAQIPFDPQLVTLCDQGRVEDYTSAACNALATAVLDTFANAIDKVEQYGK